MGDLGAYVPRLVLRWAEEAPDARYRRLTGTLAFCDLSGFTAMSEKLASLGRLGAEELADVLNLLFSALLDDAAAFGGALLKYGGDAVLLFFEGDDHARRGAAAVHRMRATLRRLGRVRTSKGIVRVRMSVGVHSGEFDFFLVGQSHRELIVAGQGATTTVDMEAGAEAGEILLSAATAALLAPSSSGAAKGKGVLLARAPRVAEVDADAFGASPSVDPTPFVPVGLRNHVGEVGTDAEHRHIGVGFVAFGGVDELLATQGGDATAKVLDAFASECQAVFARYDATFLYADIYGDGGKIFFITGAPVAHEDNEERLIRAALDISAGNHGLHLHTGLNRGYVFAGDIGSTRRRTYTVLGDAVNTAARVTASCDADGQVRAMPSVVDLASSRYETTEQAPFTAKGKAEPITTVAVGQPLGPRLSDAPLALIARRQELQRLRAALDDALSGQAGAVIVTGPAGIGKSRLISEAVGPFRSSTVAAGAYDRASPFHIAGVLLRLFIGDKPAEATLRSASSAGPRSLAKFVAVAADVAGADIQRQPGDAALTHERLPARLADVIRILWTRGDCDVLVIENAQFVDEASARVLQELEAATKSDPRALIVSTRDDEGSSPNAIVLERLSEDATDELARRANPRLLPHESAKIAARAGGQPLFVRQLAASEAGVLATSIETAIAARIDSLPPDARDVLRIAAVLGERSRVEDLRELAGAQAIDLARLNDFLQTDGRTVRFRQPLYREVAYEGLPFRRRQMLHRAVLRLISEDPATTVDRLALHAHAAGDWEASWRYSRIAADRAFETIAKSTAAGFFEQALTAGRKLGVPREELAAVAADLGRALWFVGNVDGARAAYRTCRRLAPRTGLARALLESREAAIFDGQGDHRKALELYKRGLAALEGTESALDPATAYCFVQLLIGRAWAENRVGDNAAAKQTATDAIAYAESAGHPLAIGTAHNLAAAFCIDTGDVDAGIHHGRIAVEVMRSHTEISGRTAIQIANLASLEQVAGNLREATKLAAEAADMFDELDHDWMAAATRSNLAEILICQGRWDEARSLGEEAERVLRVVGHEAAPWTRLLIARAALRRGSDAEIDDSDIEGADVISPGEAPAFRVEQALVSGDVTGARRIFDAAEFSSATALGPVLDAAIAHAEGVDTAEQKLKEAEATGDRLSAVMLRVMLGADLAADPNAHELGIVDVPVWVTNPGSSPG